MRSDARNPQVPFFAIPGADHFTALAPTTALIARKILADTGATASIAFTPDELAAPFR